MADTDVKNNKNIEMETVGDRIKVIRKSLGMKQSDFAKAVGSVQSTVSCIERNLRPIVPEILNHLRDMGYSTEWILYGTANGNLSTKKFGNVLQQIGANRISVNHKEILEIIQMLDELTPEQLQYIKGVIFGLKVANGAGNKPQDSSGSIGENTNSET